VDEAESATSSRTRWAGVRLDATVPERLDFVVEDSGNGPGPAEREHLFDPFYSGRKAGRGRGLGLATAWRLAREHGGDVAFDSHTPGPTRFILSLPRVEPHRDATPDRPHVNGCHVPSAAAH
jgi:signal transduction histidine kinase